MSLHGPGDDWHLLRWTTRRCQGMEGARPDAFGCPTDEAIVEGLARAISGRGIYPATTGLQHMNDPADDTAIIGPWFATRIARKIRLKPRKLIIVQPEAVAIL